MKILETLPDMVRAMQHSAHNKAAVNTAVKPLMGVDPAPRFKHSSARPVKPAGKLDALRAQAKAAHASLQRPRKHTPPTRDADVRPPRRQQEAVEARRAQLQVARKEATDGTAMSRAVVRIAGPTDRRVNGAAWASRRQSVMEHGADAKVTVALSMTDVLAEVLKWDLFRIARGALEDVEGVRVPQRFDSAQHYVDVFRCGWKLILVMMIVCLQAVAAGGAASCLPRCSGATGTVVELVLQ